MDKTIVAEVNAHVRDPGTVDAEKDQVARGKIFAVDRRGVSKLAQGGPGQGNIDLLETVKDQSTTIKTLTRGGPSKSVGDAQLFFGCLDDFLAFRWL